MIRVAITEARAHARRLGLIAAAIVVAVTFMAGSFVLADSVRATTVSQSAALQPPGLAAAVVGIGSLPHSVVAEIAAVPGVARTQPLVSGYGQLLVGGRLFGSSDSIVVSSPTVPALSPGRIVLGHGPASAEQVVVDSGTFAAAHLRIGQQVRVVSSQPDRLFTLVGVVQGVAIPGSPNASVIVPDMAVAQQLTGLQGRVSEVLVSATPGQSLRPLAARLQAVVGPSGRALTAAALSALMASQATHKVLSFTTTLTVLVCIALVVGAFIIFNAFALLVAQRRRELALLRCLGTSRTQLALLVAGEAAAVGLVASAIGLGLGFGTALVLRALVQASGTPLPTGPLHLQLSSAAICLAAGTGVAVVASIIPAEQAGRVPALVALRQDPVAEGTMSHPVRRPVAAVVAVLGAGLAVVGLVAPAPASVVVGGLMVVLGIAGLGQAPVAASAGVLGWPIARLWGFAGALGRQNAVRHPRRTAASSASVVVGVALICALAVIASSAHASADDQLSQTVLSDYVLSAAGSGPASGGPSVVQPLPAGVVPNLRAQPALGEVSPLSYLTFHVDGHGTDWGAAVDASNFTRMIGLGQIQGNLGGLRTGGVAIEQSLAAGRGWHLGQVLPFVFPAQDGADKAVVSYRPITALFDSLGYYGGFLFSAATLTGTYPDLPPSIVFTDRAAGVSTAAARAAVARALVGYPEVSVSDPAGVQATQDQAINRQIDLVAVLSLLALIIGYLGIVTNLMLSVTERVREIGLLRAVGMSTRQLGAALRFESAIIAALGALVGAVVGLCGAWTLQRSLTSDGLTTLSVPWPTLVVYVALAVIIGVVGGILPARQAARVPVLEALADE